MRVRQADPAPERLMRDWEWDPGKFGWLLVLGIDLVLLAAVLWRVV